MKWKEKLFSINIANIKKKFLIKCLLLKFTIVMDGIDISTWRTF